MASEERRRLDPAKSIPAETSGFTSIVVGFALLVARLRTGDMDLAEVTKGEPG
jgi:hypothetical protein